MTSSWHKNRLMVLGRWSFAKMSLCSNARPICDRTWACRLAMMTSSNGNISRVTGPLCGEFTGHRWIPRTKASDAELWCFYDLRLNKQLNKQSRGWWFETLSCSLWRHCNANLLGLLLHVVSHPYDVTPIYLTLWPQGDLIENLYT